MLCYIQECTCSKGTVLVCAVCEAWASLAGPTSGIVEKVPSISLSDERLKQVAEHYGVSTAQAREGDRKSRAWDFSSGTLSFLHRCHPTTLCEFPVESSSNFRFAIKRVKYLSEHLNSHFDKFVGLWDVLSLFLQVELRWETQKRVVPITATCTKAGDILVSDHVLCWRHQESRAPFHLRRLACFHQELPDSCQTQQIPQRSETLI